MRRPLLAAAAVVALLSGCGSGDDLSAEDLDGNSYLSTEVEGRDLVQDATIGLSFEDDRMTATAGCNTQSGSYEVDGDTLRWSEPVASTMMACSPELEEQDRWLHELLTDGVTASLDGSTLTLESVDVNIVLEAE